MNINAQIIGYTNDINNPEEISKDAIMSFCGKQAAICYANDSYFGDRIQNRDGAIKRFNTVIPTLHHSIADHYYISMLIEAPKIVCMVLNSLNFYATSEKSGRYTKMTGNTEKECEIYDKWNAKFIELINNEYPDIEEKTVKKLAMENARYVLSVFTETTMSYSTSARQWNYIVDWFEKFVNDYKDRKIPICDDKLALFTEQLVPAFEMFIEKVKPLVYIEGLRDAKQGRWMPFLRALYQEELHIQSGMKPTICTNSTYETYHKSSFAALAQEQRHRTLRYEIVDIENEYFIPPIFNKDETLIGEWVTDLESLKDLIPQGTLVEVRESGHVDDFIMKCQERICGRAQLEITRITANTFDKLCKASCKFVGEDYSTIMKYVAYCKNEPNKRYIPKTKCGTVNCKERCMWRGEHIMGRKI